MSGPVDPWAEETIPILRVTDADVAVRWYERLGFRRGVAQAEFGVEVRDAGSRSEVHLTDPDGNRLSIGARKGRPAEGYAFPDPS